MATKRVREAEDLKRRKQARQRFRGLIRSVIFNRIWLNDIGDQKLSLNVKKNIAMLVRVQRKIGMLTLAEKALIRTVHSFRTIEDRKKLVTLLASMTCFSKIPPKVRARLVPIVKFLYVTPRRTIIKEDDIPMTVYFILTGEVEITKRVYDHIQKDYVEKVESISGPGDCLGDVEMIENTLRKNTYTATTDVELLVVYDLDFDRILRPVMGKQWLEKKAALNVLNYFKFFTEEQLIGACKLGVLRQFEPLESIYYEDKGHLSYVHFVLSGECMILQCLKMKVTQAKGRKAFELVDISKDDGDMFQDLTNMELMMQLKKDQTLTEFKTNFDIDHELASNEDLQNDKRKRKKSIVNRKVDIKTMEISCGFRTQSGTSIRSTNNENKENVNSVENPEKLPDYNENVNNVEDGKNMNLNEGENGEIENVTQNNDNTISELNTENDLEPTESLNKRNTYNEQSEIVNDNGYNNVMRKSISNEQLKKYESTEIMKEHEYTSEKENMENVDEDQENVDESEFIEMEENEENTEFYDSGNESSSTACNSIHLTPTGSQERTPSSDDSKIENHFIDVGSFTYGGIFGLGEELEHRVIMARTTVQCIMIPRFWLFEKEQNPGNIWQRRKFYLDCTIPSRQSLFKDFLTTRKWQKFKNDLIQSNLDPNSGSNPTKVQDIPIICRIVEAHDE